MYPLLGLVLLVVCALGLRLSYLKKKEAKTSEDFWSREEASRINIVRDISNLPYITIPIENFPLDYTDDPDAVRCADELKALSNEKILNLTGMTNTDLRENYGANNFKEISAYGENYDRLVILLRDYSKCLLAHDMVNEAITVLEYAVSIHSDISSTYTDLADCYIKVGKPRSIRSLISDVKSMDLPLGSQILSQLESRLEACGLAAELSDPEASDPN